MLEADLRRKLEGDVDVAVWRDLRTHAARDNLFIVNRDLDLVDVAVALAQDDATKVGGWISACQLSRPSEPQLSAWEAHLDKQFDSVIVSPFVLVMTRLDA